MDYFTHYTFNDNSIVDALDTMLEAARIYKEPRYLVSAEKGGEFMLLSQMPEPQPGWAQQYDRDMHPAWARQFEPPSVTGGESQSVMRALMLLYRETGKTASTWSRCRAHCRTTSGRSCPRSSRRPRSGAGPVPAGRRAQPVSTS